MTAAKRSARDVGLRQLASRSWQARYTDEQGRTISQTFAGKADAKRWRAGQVADVARGSHVDPTDTTTVAEYARRSIAARDIRASTRARYTSMVSTHLDSVPLGAMRLGDVRPTDLREWLTDRSTVLAPSTLAYLRTFVAAVFAGARADRLITWSPAETVKLKPAGPSRKPYRRQVLTDEQIEALRVEMPPCFHALVVLLAVAGLRIGEALALRVEDVDRERGVIHVRRTMAPNGKTAGPVKGERSERSIPVPRHLTATLSAHMLAHPPIDHPLGRLVFSTVTGKPVRYDRLRKQFERAATRAGVDGATPHALRHRAGSVLLHRGVPPATAAAAMGHTVRVLLATYAHALPDGDDLARAAMELRAETGTALAREGTSGGLIGL